MIWPFISPSEFELPGLSSGDRLVQIASVPQRTQAPFAIISTTAVYVINQQPVAVLAAHYRSQESIENYGYNVSVKLLAKNAGVILVETSQNYLIVYTLSQINQRPEILQIYSHNSDRLIQDVFPVDRNISFFNFKGFSSKNNNDSDENIDYDPDEGEAKLNDSGLRFRLMLKIQNTLIDYDLVSDKHLCILTNKRKSDDPGVSNVAIQIINIESKFEEINSFFIEEFEWFDEKNLHDFVHFAYDEKSNLFSFITNNGNCWLFRSTNTENKLDLTKTFGYCFYSSSNAKKLVINNAFNLIFVITDSNNIFYYTLKSFAHKKIRLLKKFKKPLNAKRILSLKFTRNGKSIVVLYSNGWCLLSIFGNINFSTFDYDDTLGVTGIVLPEGLSTTKSDDSWLADVRDIDFYSNDSNLVFINSRRVFLFNLLKCNLLAIQSDSSTKRPILHHNSLLYIFKGIEYLNYQRQFESIAESLAVQDQTIDLDTNNDLAASWNILDIPTNKYHQLDPIKILSVSNDGLNVAIYGKNTLYVYTYTSNSWHLFMDFYYDYMDINCNILWWENSYIFLDNYNSETKRHELLMFNVDKAINYTKHRTKSESKDQYRRESDVNHENGQHAGDNSGGVGRETDYGTPEETHIDSKCIIWKYEFDTPIKYLNLDNSINELLIVTEDLKLLIFKLEQQIVSKTSPLGAQRFKKQVLINLVIKLPLNNLHIDLHEASGNFNLIKLSQYSNDLLILINGNLYFLNLVKDDTREQLQYESFLVFNNIEFMNKIDDDSFYFFNGDEILYLNDLNLKYKNVDHNTSNEKSNMFKRINNLQTLKISNFDEQFYPLALNSLKDFYITGLTIDIVSSMRTSSKILKVHTTKKTFLHDLLNFEINKLIIDSFPEEEKSMEVSPAKKEKLDAIYEKYKDSVDLEYSLELLLYMVTTKNNENDSKSNTDFKLRLLLNLIMRLGDQYLGVIAKCLRKIEIEYWDRIFTQLQQDPKTLLHKCIEIKNYKTAGYYLTIFLSHKTIGTTNVNSNANETDTDDISADGKEEIMQLLKIIAENLNSVKYNKNNELWDMGIELIRFLKVLDVSGEILSQAVSYLSI